MIDMFNYKYQSNMTHWKYDEAAEGFVVIAKEDIPEGKEVIIACEKANKIRFTCIMETSQTPASSSSMASWLRITRTTI